jgi:hypothetical protein
MNFFAAGGEDGFSSPGKLAVLHMPGYGKGSREERGPDIMKYLSGIRQYVIHTPPIPPIICIFVPAEALVAQHGQLRRRIRAQEASR